MVKGANNAPKCLEFTTEHLGTPKLPGPLAGPGYPAFVVWWWWQSPYILYKHSKCIKLWWWMCCKATSCRWSHTNIQSSQLNWSGLLDIMIQLALLYGWKSICSYRVQMWDHYLCEPASLSWVRIRSERGMCICWNWSSRLQYAQFWDWQVHRLCGTMRFCISNSRSWKMGVIWIFEIYRAQHHCSVEW